MPPHDAHDSAAPHPDVAGWVLQALDHDDAMSFATHLHQCAECRAAVAELRPAAQAMTHAAPALEPPADLGTRTLLAVQQAAAAKPAKPQAGSRAKAIRFARWRHPGLLVTAAVAAAAAIIAVTVITVPSSKPGQTIHAARFVLHGPPGSRAGGQAIGTDHGQVGWSFRLSVHGLPMLPSKQFYECWYVGNPEGHPKISGGTFTLGPNGAGTFTMWTGADPHHLRIMWITKRTIGSARPGPIVLTAQVQL